MRILPAEYGIAGFLSVTRRDPTDLSEDYERALLGAAAQTLADDRFVAMRRNLRLAEKQKSERLQILVEENRSLRSRCEEQARLLVECIGGASNDASQSVIREMVDGGLDVEALRRENKALRTSLEWHAAEVARLSVLAS